MIETDCGRSGALEWALEVGRPYKVGIRPTSRGWLAFRPGHSLAIADTPLEAVKAALAALVFGGGDVQCP